MDLQAILAASDSSEDGEAGELPSSFRFSDASTNVELEEILREGLDDDDDDDVLNVGVHETEERNTTSRALWQSGQNGEHNKEFGLGIDRSFSDDHDTYPSESFTSQSHNAEDWAVLQAILQEDEDDDNSSSANWLEATRTRSPFLSQDRVNMEELLRSEESGHGSVDDAVTLIKTVLGPSAPHASPEARVNGSDVIGDHPVSDGSNGFSPAIERSGEGVLPGTKERTPRKGDPKGSNTWLDEEVSIRAMAYAQAYERKLLMSGQREIVSPLMVKRRLKPKIDLSSRSSGQKRRQTPAERLASSAIPRFGFSGIVENKPMADVSKSMANHSRVGGAKVHCGLPTCLAFNSKFIAVGTQLGFILVWDLFEVLRQRLSTAALEDHVVGGKKPGSITAIDLSYNGEVVVAGYASGLLLLWDTIKGVVLRTVSDTHPSPITSVRFLADLKMITVDAGGLVNKLAFAKNLLWSNYSMDTDCLLDGTAGQILAMDILMPFSTVNPLVRPDSLSLVLRNLSLIALSSERSSFVVAVEPKVHVLHRWARPPTERVDAVESVADLPTDQTYLPCLTWGWALVSGGQNVVMPILARAWGCCLQLLCMSFPSLETDAASGPQSAAENQIHWPAFGMHQEIDTTTPVVTLEWLNDRSLAYLTVTNEFTLVDTVMMVLLERLDFSGLKLVYAEFSLSRNASMALESASSCTTTFQNSVRSSDDRLMVLCREEVKCISVVSARRRISTLEEDGEWLEALALALDHYESTVVSQEDRKRDQSGRKDLSRHPEFAGAKSEDEEWIAKLLMRYISLAVDNAPETSRGQTVDSVPEGENAIFDLAQSHFQMLAGVCVEFCVVTRRLDLLFGPIFRRFQTVGFTSVFLDVLEPYVLTDKLAYIAPEVMSFFVEHCKATNGIATVERCLLHMDCTIMDFDTILSLLRANEMYSALFYVFNQGLDDYITPLELLLERVFDEADSGSATKSRRGDGAPQSTFERFGYKAILYLRTCFQGVTFPQEKELAPDERRLSVKRELMAFLTRESFVLSPHVRRADAVVGQRALLHPYVRLLLQVDPRAMLDTVSIALDSVEETLVRTSASTSGDDWDEDNMPHAHMPDRQEVMTVLASIVLPTPGGLESLALQSPGLVNAFLDFTAKYLMSSAIRVDKEIIFMIVRRMADRFASATDSEQQQKAQRQIMELLSALPRDSYDPDNILDLIARAGIHRAALLLHQQVASSWHEDRTRDIQLRSSHFCDAIDCYLDDHDEAFRREVFDYVKKECSGVSNSSAENESGGPTSLRDALFSKLPSLVRLDSLMTARLVAELFVDDLDRVVASLEAGKDGGNSLFQFFQAIISGLLVQVDPVAGSVLNLTMEHHHKYLALMARLHPEMVYEYLSTHDNYRAEECLKLCQEYDIADASAYLLERLGNVSSALQLILQTLESRMMNLKRTIRGIGVDILRQYSSRVLFQNRKSYGLPSALSSNQIADIERVKRILIVALDLCERNSGSLSSRSEHGSQLWFNVLDRLINAKGFLRLSKEQPEHAKVMAGVLSELLRLTMQRMVSNVPLPDLVRKLTSDKGSRLGELREMVESLLGTYGFELRVFEGAVTVFQQDVNGMQAERRSLQLEAAPVRSVMAIPLTEEKTKEVDHFLRRSSRLDMALSVGANGTSSIVQSDVQHSRSAEGGLVSALSKLRSRRGGVSDGGGQKPASSRSGLNMMTSTELLFLSGESDPVVMGQRPVGALGDAQHRGRLVTFQ